MQVLPKYPDKFTFELPVELIKSADGDWNIRGLASTEAMDAQGETVLQKGIDLTHIEKQKGYINWDHKPGPENLIGVLDGYKRQNNQLYVEGRLFKAHDKAKAVKGILDSLGERDRGRMGLSVEGAILQRNAKNPSIIEKSIITGVALTMNPVNSETYVDLMKSLTAGEIEIDTSVRVATERPTTLDNQVLYTTEEVAALIKALGIGGANSGNTAPNQLSGGAALAVEELGKDPKQVEPLKKDAAEAEKEAARKKAVAEKTLIKAATFTPKHRSFEIKVDSLKKSLINILDDLHKLYPECSRSELWAAVQDRLDTKFPKIES